MTPEAPDHAADGTRTRSGLHRGPDGAELRLDVDGRYPQMVASGVVAVEPAVRVSWIARLAPSGDGRLAGPIVHLDPDAPPGFPYREVALELGAPAPQPPPVRVVFGGGGGAPLQLTFAFVERTFRAVEVEVDSVAGEQAVLALDTCAHPKRPPDLSCERLTLQETFARAGVRVTSSPGSAVSPAPAGADGTWTHQELHDAMQVYWSHAAAPGPWALWALVATAAAEGAHLGGVMFDDVGPEQRRACAVFNDSFVARPPDGDPNPKAWVERMRLWALCHEVGHCLNLAHSWLKSAGVPWIALGDDPEARSFMNYPGRVEGGQEAFFADFAYRFTDAELTFLRHAPERFVRTGAAAFSEDHALADVAPCEQPPLRLALRAERAAPRFAFMEPVRLELELKNVSAAPQTVDRRALELGATTVAIERAGRPPRVLHPFYVRDWAPEPVRLAPGESLRGALPVASDTRGWAIDEPGRYTVAAGVALADRPTLWAHLDVDVAAPCDGEEERLAEEWFSADVARTLALQGSTTLLAANDVLRELVARRPHSRAALHAQLALGNAVGPDRKVLVPDDGGGRPLRVALARGDADAGRALLQGALLERPDVAVETFGSGGYRRRVERLQAWLGEHDAEPARTDADRQEQQATTIGGKR